MKTNKSTEVLHAEFKERMKDFVDSGECSEVVSKLTGDNKSSYEIELVVESIVFALRAHSDVPGVVIESMYLAVVKGLNDGSIEVNLPILIALGVLWGLRDEVFGFKKTTSVEKNTKKAVRVWIYEKYLDSNEFMEKTINLVTSVNELAHKELKKGDR